MLNVAIVVGVIFAGVVGGYLYYLYISKKDKENEKNELLSRRNKETSFGVWFEGFSQKNYTFLMRVPVVKNVVGHVRKRLETLAIYDEFTLRKEVIKLLFKVVGFALLLVFGVLLFRPSWLVFLWVFIGILFITGVMVDYYVYRVETKLLNELKVFNSRLRYYYQQTKMVDIAVYETIQFVKPEMAIQAHKIYDILMSADPERELSKYEEVAPSRFLKVVAALLVMIKDQGDVVNDKGSAFLRGLSSINKELNEEILYRTELSYQLRGMSVVALAPVFIALPLKNWAGTYFPVMSTFYESRVGYMTEVAVYATSIVAYIFIRKMREVKEANYRIGVKDNKWEQFLIDKVPLAGRVVRAFTPAETSKGYFKLKQLIRDVNSPQKVEWVTVHRILLSVTAVVVIVGGTSFAYEREKQAILFDAVPESYYAGSMDAHDLAEHESRAVRDRHLLDEMSKQNITNGVELKTYLALSLGASENSLQVNQTYDRLVRKWEVMENSYLKWYEVLLGLVLALGMWHAPTLMLRFQRYLRHKDMENEVRAIRLATSV